MSSRFLLVLLIIAITTSSAFLTDNFDSPLSNRRLLQELEMELDLEAMLPKVRSRRAKACGQEVLVLARNYCDGGCDPTGIDMATECCKGSCDEKFVRTACCPKTL